MFQTTLDYLEDKQTVWNGKPAFVDGVTRAKAMKQAIDDAGDKQQTPTTGTTQDKADLRSELEFETLSIADQLASLATKTGDNELLAKVQTNKSALDGMKDSDLEQFAERVVALGNDNIAALADYGIDAAAVTTLDGLRGQFKSTMTAPRQKTADKKAQTQSLSQRIADLRSLFRSELDKLVTPFRKTNLDFYNGYFVARVIVNRAATHEAKAKPAPPAPAPSA